MESSKWGGGRSAGLSYLYSVECAGEQQSNDPTSAQIPNVAYVIYISLDTGKPACVGQLRLFCVLLHLGGKYGHTGCQGARTLGLGGRSLSGGVGETVGGPGN